MSFENQIQQWVQLDNQLKQLNEKIRDIREKKTKLTQNITNYAKNNNLENNTIKITDGKLRFANVRVQEPLSYKYLERTLSEIIKNPQQIELIMNHIKKSREIKIVNEIKRFSDN